jgi:membrane-bound lytic murein transglycosylase B
MNRTVAASLSLALLAWHAGVCAQPSADSQAARFSEWLAELRAEAVAGGISEATVNAALTAISPLERIIELDRNQPEFKLDFWTYVDRVVTESRVEQGRRLLVEHGPLLEDVSRRYGMPAHLLVAVWGVESNFGAIQGSFAVIEALATLAYDERRASMFRRELIHALRIVDQGHIELARMRGSWAGAMGQLQFMPSTFIDYAKDGDGDGRKDIWGSAADALESAANFMAPAWRPGYIWGRQVELPADFDRALADLDVTKPLAEWQSLGVRQVDGSSLQSAGIDASVVLPAAGREPAFLVYDNFRALMRWNRSQFFAIAVGHLGDRIAGRPPLQR